MPFLVLTLALVPYVQGAWLSTAPIGSVDAFVKSGGPAVLSGLLADLCRHSTRADSDTLRIELVMRILKALIKAEAGLNAVISSPALICQSFASRGGSLLLADSESLLQPAVQILSAVAVYSDAGHRSVLTALEELYFFHATQEEAPVGTQMAWATQRPKPFEPIVERLLLIPWSSIP